jgi:hypothetical protein
MSFTIAAGPRQRSYSEVRVPRDSWPHFIVLDSRLPQQGGPGPRIYIPQEQCGPVISPGTGFPFRHLLRLAGLRWRYSTPHLHGISQVTHCLWSCFGSSCHCESLTWDVQQCAELHFRRSCTGGGRGLRSHKVLQPLLKPLQTDMGGFHLKLSSSSYPQPWRFNAIKPGLHGAISEIHRPQHTPFQNFIRET